MIMNEFEWEKFFKESDKRTDKFQQLFEKYIEHPNRDEIVAEEMGWNEPQEEMDGDELEVFDEVEFSVPLDDLRPNPLTEGIDWVRNEDGHIHHPLTLKIIEASMKMWHHCKEKNLLNHDEDVLRMVTQFQITGAKVAGALDCLGFDDGREGGFIVACLKRSLNYLHQSVAAAERVKNKKAFSSDAVEEYQKILFEIREQILDLMNHFRKKDSSEL